MKNNLYTVSKVTVYFMILSVILVYTVLIPEIIREETFEGTSDFIFLYSFLIWSWIVSIPVFVALHQILKLIGHISDNTAFSNQSVKILQNIKICTFIFNLFVLIGTLTLTVYGRSVGEDVTPFITLSFIIVFITSTIATFVAVLQKLLQDAINIKNENDFIV